MALSALSVGEKFSTGGITTVLGLGMTFVVLALLIGCVYLVSVIVQELTKFINKQREARKAKKTVTEQTVSAAENTEASASAVSEIDAETMVAIQSAVEIYLRENGGNDGKPHENVTIKSVTKL